MRHGKAFSLSLLWVLVCAPFVSAQPLPAPVAGSLLLPKTALTISYHPGHKQADWVFYTLSARELQDCVKRSNQFRPDPKVPAKHSAQLSDYKNSGFDRGHMSPAADNRWSQQAMSESFHLSNISPQPPGFNQGIWSRLEHLVRAWAQEKGGLWVTTGPVLHRNLRSIGANGVSTPEHFYKVLATTRSKSRQAIAFLLPVEARGELGPFSLSIAALEAFTGLDFLKGLPDEEKLEESHRPANWSLEAQFRAPPCRAFSFSSEPGLLFPF